MNPSRSEVEAVAVCLNPLREATDRKSPARSVESAASKPCSNRVDPVSANSSRKRERPGCTPRSRASDVRFRFIVRDGSTASTRPVAEFWEWRALAARDSGNPGTFALYCTLDWNVFVR